VVFRKGTNDFNQFTVAEVIAGVFGLLSDSSWGGPWPTQWSIGSTLQFQTSLPFPDFSRIVIHRPNPEGTNWTSIPLNVGEMLNSGSGDIPLRWGDVVEIPEADHPVSEPWRSLTSPDMLGLSKLVSRTFTIGINRTNVTFLLAPQYIAHPDRFPVGEGAQQLVVGDARLTRVSFMLRSVLDESRLIRFSSDLTRVRVIRTDAPANKMHEWTFDCSDPKNAPDFWLRDGDVIEVPER
jgi:hypothetical protein